jgi:hypothetical protein
MYSMVNQNTPTNLELAGGTIFLSIFRPIVLRVPPVQQSGWTATGNPALSSTLPLTNRFGFQWPATSNHRQTANFNNTWQVAQYSLPLWLPLLITVIPTTAIFWADFRKASAHRPTNIHKAEHWPNLPSILIGIVAFIALFFAADFVIDTICLGLWGKEFFILPPNPEAYPTLDSPPPSSSHL